MMRGRARSLRSKCLTMAAPMYSTVAKPWLKLRPVLKVGQHFEDFALPQKFSGFLAVETVAHQFVDRAQIEVVGRDLRQRPRRGQFAQQACVEGLRLVPPRGEPLLEHGVVLIAMDDDVEFGIVRDAAQREVARPDDGNALLHRRQRVMRGIVDRAVVKDIGLGVQPPLGVDAHFQPFFLDEAHQRTHQLLRRVALFHGRHALADGRGRGRDALVAFRAFGVGHGVEIALHRVEPAIALGDLLDGLTVGGVADEQAQLAHVAQHIGHCLQPRNKEVADGKVRGLAARQHRADAVGEFDALVVDDVVGHMGSRV